MDYLILIQRQNCLSTKLRRQKSGASYFGLVCLYLPWPEFGFGGAQVKRTMKTTRNPFVRLRAPHAPNKGFNRTPASPRAARPGELGGGAG